MKAARLHDYDAPLRVQEVPVPELTARDDVIVRVGGGGLCRTDLHLIDGALAGAIADMRPLTLGHETAGWVEAVGDESSAFALGDPVLLHPIRTCGSCPACRRGRDMFCANASFTGMEADGGFAEFVRTSSRALVALPQELDPTDLAPYADAGLTVMRAVKKATALLAPDQTVAVVGVGGLGHIAVQLLAAMTPAALIAIDSSPAARELASELGVSHVVDPAVAGEAVAELTGGKGVDVALDFVGDRGTPALTVSLLGQGGVYLVVGYGEQLELPTAEVVVKEIRIEGTLVGTHAELTELVAMVERGQVSLHTTRYALGEINGAIEDLRAGRLRGRALIVPDGNGRP